MIYRGGSRWTILLADWNRPSGMFSFNHDHVEDCLWTMIQSTIIFQGLGNQEVSGAQANHEHDEIGWKKLMHFSAVYSAIMTISDRIFPPDVIGLHRC